MDEAVPLVCVACESNRVVFLDPVTLISICEISTLHSNRSSIAIHDNYVAVTSASNRMGTGERVYLYDPYVRKKKVGELSAVHHGMLWGLEFLEPRGLSGSPLVCSGCDAGYLFISDAENGKVVRTLEDSPCTKVIKVDQSRGEVFVGGGTFGEVGDVVVFDATKGIEVADYEGHTDIVWGLDYDEESRVLFSCADDETLKCWDRRGPLSVREIRLTSKGKSILCLPDHHSILCGDEHGIAVFDSRWGSIEVQRFAHPDDPRQYHSCRSLESLNEEVVLSVWRSPIDHFRGGPHATLTWNLKGKVLASAPYSGYSGCLLNASEGLGDSSTEQDERLKFLSQAASVDFTVEVRLVGAVISLWKTLL